MSLVKTKDCKEILSYSYRPPAAQTSAVRQNHRASGRQQALLPPGQPQGEPSHSLKEAQASPCCALSNPPPHTHCPTARCDRAGSGPWPGVTHAQGCAWACWLTSPWPLAGGPPAQAATREGREARKPRQTGPAARSMGLSWDGSVLGGKWGDGDHSWWGCSTILEGQNWRGRC